VETTGTAYRNLCKAGTPGLGSNGRLKSLACMYYIHVCQSPSFKFRPSAYYSGIYEEVDWDSTSYVIKITLGRLFLTRVGHVQYRFGCPLTRSGLDVRYAAPVMHVMRNRKGLRTTFLVQCRTHRGGPNAQSTMIEIGVLPI
jgi:hypothetical protein